ncbi:MAG: 30S ribosomal protein S21 [bacterium]
MVSIKVRPGEPIDRVLKRFRSQVKRAGIQRDAKKSRHYVKPSEKRKIAKRRAERRHQKRRELQGSM